MDQHREIIVKLVTYIDKQKTVAEDLEVFCLYFARVFYYIIENDIKY